MKIVQKHNQSSWPYIYNSRQSYTVPPYFDARRCSQPVSQLSCPAPVKVISSRGQRRGTQTVEEVQWWRESGVVLWGKLNIYRCHIWTIHINIILVTLLLLKKLFVIIISGKVYYVCENIYLLIKLKSFIYFIVQNLVICIFKHCVIL